LLDEFARIAKLAGEKPHEITGRRRARVRAVPCLVDWHSFHDAGKLRLLGLEAFLVVLAKILHGVPPVNWA
jgi:hypothetical protein